MGVIVTRNQPQGRVVLDRRNPLVAGALAIINPSTGRNEVSGLPLVRGGSTSLVGTPLGIAANFNGSYLETEMLPAIGAASFVEFWYGYPSSAYLGGGSTATYADFVTGSKNNLIGLYQKRQSGSGSWGITDSWNQGTMFVDAAQALTAGVPALLVALYKGATAEFYANGAFVSSASITATSFAATTMLAGAFIEDAANWSSQSQTILAGRIVAPWTAKMVADFSANPWQIFAPAPRVRFAGAAPINGAVFGAITEQADAASGTATKSSALAGSPAESSDSSAGAAMLTAMLTGNPTEQPDLPSSAIQGIAYRSAGSSSIVYASSEPSLSRGALLSSSLAGNAIEASDVPSGVAMMSASLAGSATEQPDTCQGAIGSAAAASMVGSPTEQPDTCSGTLALSASLAGSATEQPDIGSGSVGTAGVTSVSGSVVEQPEVANGTAALTAALFGSITEQADTGIGTIGQAIGVYGNVTEQADTASGAMSLSASLSGAAIESADAAAAFLSLIASLTAAVTEQMDVGLGTITALSSLALSMNATEQPDIGSATLMLFVPFSPSTVTPPSRTLPIFDEGRFPIYGVVGRSSMFKRDVIGLFIRKDPDSTLDYRLDWAPPGDSWLGTDVITSATWKIDDGIDNDASSNTATTATIWLAGGTAGSAYNVTCRITTAAGRIDDRSFRVIVQNR